MTDNADKPRTDADAASPRQAVPPRLRRQAATFLAGDRTPMWFTLVILVAGAAGTYYLAPRVNAEFEAQKIKTDFVIRNYSDLRAKMEELQGLYSMLVQKIILGEDVKPDLYRFADLVGRIGAQNVSMLPMFTHAEGPKASAELHTALNAMMTVLFAHAGREFTTEAEIAAFDKEVAAASARLVPPLLELYVRIGEIGQLNPTEKDVDLQDAK